MKRSKFTDSQILSILKQAEGGTPVSELCREHIISAGLFYKWRAKFGGMDASTILRKLNTQSRKNKIYQAFRELGRVIRTIFLLNYINDIELRRVIHAATCKSEEFNNFIDWVAFGHDGTITDNLQGIQKKIINFGRLAANAVILHVVANMTNVINEMKMEGYDIRPEMLNGLSPYHTGHLNRFGLFPMTGDREKLRVEFKLN